MYVLDVVSLCVGKMSKALVLLVPTVSTVISEVSKIPVVLDFELFTACGFEICNEVVIIVVVFVFVDINVVVHVAFVVVVGITFDINVVVGREVMENVVGVLVRVAVV